MGRVIPTGWVGEQHVREDLGFIPGSADRARAIRAVPWMGRTQKIEAEVDSHPDCPVDGLDSARKPEPLAVPLVSDMILTIGGVDYPWAPFNGFYFGTKIASFKAAGVKMVDHHTTSDQFMTFTPVNRRRGAGSGISAAVESVRHCQIHAVFRFWHIATAYPPAEVPCRRVVSP